MKICMDNSKQIIDAYMPLIKANARRFSFFEYEEAVDISRMIVIDAIGEYDESKGSFGNFLKLKLKFHFLNLAKLPICSSLDDLDEAGNPLLESLQSSDDLEKDLMAREIYGELYAAIDRLSPTDRAIIVGKFFNDKSNADLADELNLSYKTVANRSSLALKNLRIFLTD